METGTAAGALRPFGGYGHDDGRRSWGASLATSSGIYLAIALVAFLVGGRQAARVAEKVVDVTFVNKIAEPPPAPPVPAMPEVKPQAPAAAAPIVRPDQKIRHLDKPPPPKELLAPKQMPKQAPAEADASQDKGVAVYGEGNNGDAAGLEGGVTSGGVVGGQVGGAIELPEDGTPPLPEKANVIPTYPQEAKAAGKTATVILKAIILADGSVARVQVMRGDEPFVSAALVAVKTWKYAPARYKGQPIAVYQIIQIPFRLT
jgi:periplasmic protein TonB